MEIIKKDYIIYDFEIENIQEMMDWINEKAVKGYKIINVHYYNLGDIQKVRYILELEDLEATNNFSRNR
ncbi:hypothetical protein [Flavobacterium sp. 140616W15]|uniref:hypothetical protein n=1 Tax=Flavobacterium sp. 140616W15 TaxID=2478552 RepID=UPI000F0BF82E|nr:hypothetical protein [Flavobacterium sp. 140616W15]AYN03109.1 hypothetical protein EAG11_02165 [Flavobacterium sp. 140616W15]